MATLAGNGTTDLYFGVVGVGMWHSTASGNLTSVGERQATEVLNLATVRAVEWFIGAYMKLRFNTGYATEELGYWVVPSTWKKKKYYSRFNPEAMQANVYTGKTKTDVLNTARPVTRAIGGRKQMQIGCTIAMSIPKYVNFQSSQVTNRVLNKITATEGQRIATHFFTEVQALMSRFVSSPIKTRGGWSVGVRASAADASQFATAGRRNPTAPTRQSAAGG